MLDFIVEFVKTAAFVTLSLILFALVVAIVKSIVFDVKVTKEKEEGNKLKQHYNRVDTSVGLAFTKNKVRTAKNYSDSIKKHLREEEPDEDLLKYYNEIVESSLESIQGEVEALEKLHTGD